MFSCIAGLKPISTMELSSSPMWKMVTVIFKAHVAARKKLQLNRLFCSCTTNPQPWWLTILVAFKRHSHRSTGSVPFLQLGLPLFGNGSKPPILASATILLGLLFTTKDVEQTSNFCYLYRRGHRAVESPLPPLIWSVQIFEIWSFKSLLASLFCIIHYRRCKFSVL